MVSKKTLKKNCASCEKSASLISVSKDRARWLKELKRYALPLHTRGYKTLAQLNFPETFPVDSDLCLRVKIDKKVGNKILYWGSESAVIGTSLKSAEHAYGNYKNIGVSFLEKDGFFNIRLRTPQPYLTKDNLWERHIHFVDLRNQDKIMTISCFPQKTDKIETISIHTENNSMYVDYDGFVKAKMNNIKRICAIPKEYKIFKDDLVIIHDSKKLELSGISKLEPVVVYCKNSECGAAKNLIRRMTDLGYSNIFYFPKGFDGAFKNNLA